MEQPALKGALGEVGVIRQVAPSSRPESGALLALPRRRCGEGRGGAQLHLREVPWESQRQRRNQKGSFPASATSERELGVHLSLLTAAALRAPVPALGDREASRGFVVHCPELHSLFRRS